MHDKLLELLNGDLKLARAVESLFADEGYEKHDWSITPGSVRIDGLPHMTGQEWYARFILEITNAVPYREAVTRQQMVEAAKRAAGIDK